MQEGQAAGKLRDRIISGKALDEDARIEASVRPKKIEDFIGQSRVKENLKIAVDAARARGESLDHVLLYGPPGLGKTTLAQILANEMGSAIKISSGPLLEKKGDLTAVLTSLDSRDFFFLDEIHRMQPALEEILYPAMEDFRVDLIIGQGPGARVHPYQLNRFTLIGATTRAGLIMAPLRSRFGIVHRLEFYSPEDLLQIVTRSARILGIKMDEPGAAEIARRSRGTPRVANRLLRRVRDFAEVRAKGHITAEVAQDALKMLGVDEHGLDDVDRNLLLTIIQKYSGGPVGLNTRVAIRIPKMRTSVHDESKYESEKARTSPMMRPPRAAPGMLPMPPKTAAVKAINPVMKPRNGSTLLI